MQTSLNGPNQLKLDNLSEDGLMDLMFQTMGLMQSLKSKINVSLPNLCDSL